MTTAVRLPVRVGQTSEQTVHRLTKFALDAPAQLHYRATSASYIVQDSDDVILATTTSTVTLPAPSTVNGRTYKVVSTGPASTVTIVAADGSLVNGAALTTLTAQRDSKVLLACSTDGGLTYEYVLTPNITNPTNVLDGDYGDVSITGGVWTVDAIPAPVYSVLYYGADPTGVADSTAAINACFAAALAHPSCSGKVWFPQGKYKTTSNLLWYVTGSTPRQVHVIFDQGAQLIPTAAVSIAVTGYCAPNSDGFLNRLTVSGMYLDGTATTNATGALVGHAYTGNTHWKDCTIVHFLGATGIGLDVSDTQEDTYERVYIGRCGRAVRIQALVNPALPTVETFRNCFFRESTTKGVHLIQGYGVHFYDCVAESNQEEGYYVAPTGGSIVFQCMIHAGWCENNWNLDANQLTQYQITVDGTLGDCLFGVKDLAVNFPGYNAHFTATHNLQLRDNAWQGRVLIDSNCDGEVSGWPENNLPMATYLVNNSNLVTVTRNPLHARLANYNVFGDADATFTVGNNSAVQVSGAAFTSNRAITLSNTSAYNGATFYITTTFASGTGTLDIGGLKTIPVATKAWALVLYTGSSWILIGYGLL